MTSYNVGDVLTYATRLGDQRTVRVTYKSRNIKSFQPGFDGDIIDGPDAGKAAWGYDSQILHVYPATR